MNKKVFLTSVVIFLFFIWPIFMFWIGGGEFIRGDELMKSFLTASMTGSFGAFLSWLFIWTDLL